MLEALVTFFLCLAPLPSFIAWTKGASGLSGFVATHLGPVNPLKIAAPLFAYYLWKNRARFGKIPQAIFVLLLIIGTVSTLYAGIRCGNPWLEMREWAVMVVGCIAGGCFAVLSRSNALRICWVWIGILLLSVAMELIAPNSLKWIVGHFFDPNRVNLDAHGIMGFWDIGSLAKMAMMVFWIFGMVLLRNREKATSQNWKVLSALAVVLFLVILGTTQRGPILGFAAGSVAFLVQEFRRTRAWDLIVTVILLGALAAGAAFVTIPHQILIPRIKTMFLISDQSSYGKFSAASINERFHINRLNFATIEAYPFGNACISPQTYREYGVTENYHAHSLILQQFRAKGWLWGTLHLLAWLFALVTAFRKRSLGASFLFAGICSVFALGIVDHPWFVLNQATMIGALLLSAFT